MAQMRRIGTKEDSSRTTERERTSCMTGFGIAGLVMGLCIYDSI